MPHRYRKTRRASRFEHQRLLLPDFFHAMRGTLPSANQPGETVLHDEEDLREAWETNRDHFIARCVRNNPGHRCAAYWRFEHDCERPEDELESLRELGQLSEDEERRYDEVEARKYAV